MAKIYGLKGLRPVEGRADSISCPPYDVIKPGSPLESILLSNPDSLYHVTLGDDPASALQRLLDTGVLVEDREPGFYLYEQQYGTQRRIGFLAAPEVSPYELGNIIRHEKTFDEKVAGRIALMEATAYVTEPIWLLTKAPIDELLGEIQKDTAPLYTFVSDFHGESELCGISNRIYKITEDSVYGRALQAAIAGEALYIADGHHRYHSALRMGLQHCIAYICHTDQVEIQAYNRLIKARHPFDRAREKLDAVSMNAFSTPARHHFSIYTREGCWQYCVDGIDETDPVRRLDCAVLEETLYPLLGLAHDMIMDEAYFDYYPEQDMDKAKEAVENGSYDLAVALHPVSPEELLAVADAGRVDPEVVMPEKSTFFAPKILSGLILIPTDMVSETEVNGA